MKARTQAGMSLIELMVALVIGLIVSLAVFATFSGFEGRKRTATSLNDIEQSGNVALYVLDKWLRSAGSGFTQADGSPFGCTLTAARNGGQVLPRTAALPAPFASVSTGTANTFKLMPLLIVPDGTLPAESGNGSDVLVIMSGNAGDGEVSTGFTAAATATTLTLNNTVGLNGADQILIADLSTAGSGGACLISEVASGFAGGATTTLTLGSNGTNTSIFYAATIAGTALTTFKDTTNDVVFNLGNAASGMPPTLMVIGVGDNNTLFGFDLLQHQNPTASGVQSPIPLANAVFELHARYGVDSDDDDKVDSWLAATGDYAPAALTAGTSTALTRLQRIKAIRIGLILRTDLLEKESDPPVSKATVSLFTDLDTPITRRLGDTARRYRYRTLETTIPLRNMALLKRSSE